MNLARLRFPLSNYAAREDEDEPSEREEPTVKLDLAIERLKEATERREQTRKRAVSSSGWPAVKVEP